MLDFMRRQSTLIYLLFGGIALVLAINFGPGQGGCAPRAAGPAWLAKVEGEAISSEAYAFALRQQVAYLRQVAEARGQDIDPAMLERMGLRQHVYDQLVDTKLLAHDYTRLGGRVGDEEVARHLALRYGVAGVDLETYTGWVRGTLQMSVEHFEEGVREALAAVHMLTALSSVTGVGDAEVAEAFYLAHDRAQPTYVRFDLDRAAQLPATPAQVDAMLAGETSAVADFYRAQATRYRVPRRLRLERLGHALAEGDDGGALVAQLEGARAAGAQAATLAALGAQLGPGWAHRDLGWQAAADLPPGSAAALMGLEPGALSPPLREGGEMAIYAAQERREEERRPLGDVEREVAADLWRERGAVAASRGRAEALHRGLMAHHRPLAELTRAGAEVDGGARDARPPRTVGPWLTRDAESLPGLGADVALAEGAQAGLLHDLFAAHEGDVLPRVYRLGDAFVVAVASGRERPREDLLAGEAGALSRQLQAARAQDLPRDVLAGRRARARIAVNPAAAALLAGG